MRGMDEERFKEFNTDREGHYDNMMFLLQPVLHGMNFKFLIGVRDFFSQLL